MSEAALVLSVLCVVLGAVGVGAAILRRQYVLRQRLLSRAEATIVEFNEEQEQLPKNVLSPEIAASCIRTFGGPVVFGK